MKLRFLPLLLLAVPAAHAATPAKPAARTEAVRPAAPADPVAALLDQSREAQGKGEAELALRLAQAAIVADPARTASYVALGDLYAAAGQSEFARSYYDAALEIEPTDAGAQRAIAALGAAQNAAKTTAANNP